MEELINILLGLYCIQFVTVFGTVALVDGVYTSKKHVVTFLIPYVYIYFIVRMAIQKFKELP